MNTCSLITIQDDRPINSAVGKSKYPVDVSGVQPCRLLLFVLTETNVCRMVYVVSPSSIRNGNGAS